MKVIFYIFFLAAIFLIQWNIASANSEKSVDNFEVKNTKLNIKWAKLIEKYLVWLVNNLTDLKKRYWLENNPEIIEYSERLHSMIIDINNVQNTDISKVKAEKIMSDIISELKILNLKIKKLFKKEKEKREIEINVEREKYYSLSIKISSSLDKIIRKIRTNIHNKISTGNKDEKILLNLKNLERESQELKSIKSLNLKTNDDVRRYLLSILKKIKNEINEMKNN